MAVKPISPNEVTIRPVVPDEVIEAFNELIQASFNGVRALVRQEDVIALIIKKLNEKSKLQSPHVIFRDISEHSWLSNIEGLYSEQGWFVRCHNSIYHFAKNSVNLRIRLPDD